MGGAVLWGMPHSEGMESGNTKRYEKKAALASEDWVERPQAEGGVSGLSADKTADPLSSPLLDAPEDYAWTDGIHTVYRPYREEK